MRKNEMKVAVYEIESYYCCNQY
ncbi:hypothetical protein CBM2586_B130521 [Cupriavidus phytorum]|uniref:Uncharacterized protein n=1 Tax=Cupriavidus taiwanensis TaxID=164546 RepID=A0A375CIT4_9BURK|nr:hypothetical protein CBM2586_B130521 [Cupriavidus taiwanensis]